MKKIIYILIFSLVSGVIFVFIMFLAARLLYNINNSISFYCIDILYFFKSMNKKGGGLYYPYIINKFCNNISSL